MVTLFTGHGDESMASILDLGLLASGLFMVATELRVKLNPWPVLVPSLLGYLR